MDHEANDLLKPIKLNFKNQMIAQVAAHLCTAKGRDYLFTNDIEENHLIDGDFKFDDIRVIVEYMEDRYPTPALYPFDVRAKSVMRQLVYKMLDALESADLDRNKFEKTFYLPVTYAIRSDKFMFTNYVTMADITMSPVYRFYEPLKEYAERVEEAIAR